MAMDGDQLGVAISSAVKSIADSIDPTSGTFADDVWKAVGNEIVSHIKNNMAIEVEQTENVGIVAGGGAGLPATIVSQGSNPARTIGNGTGIS